MVCMRLVSPPRPPKRSRRRLRLGYILLALLLVMGGTTANALRPLPAANVHLTLPTSVDAQSLQLQWPAAGQAAIAADGYGLLATHGDQTPIATASIAKIVTTLCVLQKFPLSVGQSGPTLTFTAQDAAYYQYQVAQGGSSVPVHEGDQMTEYDALEAMLLPSANNIADSLATWAFGSLSNYALYANNYVLRHGLTHTHIGNDASGYDPSTVSTAADLAKLGLIAQTNPVIMSIAGQKTATIPNIGVVDNYNTVLGINNINGLKTGNNDQDMGALLFTATIEVAGKPIAISGAVMGQSSLQNALTASTQLVGSISTNFEPYTYIKKGQTIGTATTAWGTRVPIKTTSAAQLLRWRGDAITVVQSVHTTTAAKLGAIGILDVVAGPIQTTVPLALDNSASPPNYWWRATRL